MKYGCYVCGHGCIFVDIKPWHCPYGHKIVYKPIEYTCISRSNKHTCDYCGMIKCIILNETIKTPHKCLITGKKYCNWDIDTWYWEK